MKTMEFPINSEVEKTGSRSKKVRNLEEEVELIFSKDEIGEGFHGNIGKSAVHSKTPSPTKTAKDGVSSISLTSIFHDNIQTPRRSLRKSIKPSQDYEDIVNKSLSCRRSAKPLLRVIEGKENEENCDAEIMQPKWTPAKVGRVSTKRSRKSRRTVKGKNNENGLEENTENKVVAVLHQLENFDQSVNNTKQRNSGAKRDCADIVDEVQMKDFTQTEKVKDFEKKHDEQIVQNMEHLEIKTEQKSYKEINENQEHRKTHNEKDNDPKDHNVPIHITPNKFEHCQKSTENSKEEDICIIYESNISNTEIKEKSEDDSHSLSPLEGEGERTFGSYLKSKEISILDLGLNPIQDDEEGKLEENKSSAPVVEEMPSLIVCDEDDEIEAQCKLNETFEDETVHAKSKYNEDDMEVLQLSDDDGETPKKRIRIVLTNPELQNTSLLSTPKRSVKLLSTPKTLLTPKERITPKQSRKPFRFPTPYRNKSSFKFNDEIKENIRKTPNKNVFTTSIFSLTTAEPKQIVLTGVRKRSLSLCIDNNDCNRQNFAAGALDHVKKGRGVTFYSPANQTTIIDDLDILIASSVQKQKSQEKELSNKFVTERRKRSISLDSVMASSFLSKLPRPPVNQNKTFKTQPSTSVSKPLSRTKLPNFAAIHKKQFKKMESLVDHVNRKQERSQNLINSATKLKTALFEKSTAVSKNNILAGKSKALKKIDLENISQMNKSISKATTASEVPFTKIIRNLPEPPKLNVIIPIKSRLNYHNTSLLQQQKNKHLKPSQATNIEKRRLNTKSLVASKPAFNLSTSVMAKPTVSASNCNTNSTVSDSSFHDKATSRLQRHMALFKGREPSKRAGVASRRNETILQGVRSNRRFELQMLHRKNLEH